VTPAWPAAPTISRILNFWILPDGVVGISSLGSRRSGMYWIATACALGGAEVQAPIRTTVRPLTWPAM
jgi:hypothetical protein